MAAMARGLKHYVFIDYATQGYVALVGVLVLLFHGGRVPAWPWVVAGHVVCLGLIHLLIRAAHRPGAGPVLDFLRHFYPVLLYTAFYRETGLLNQMFVEGYLDPTFLGWDQRLFGCQPALQFMELAPWLLFSELLYAAYFSYYLMIVGTGMALFLRDRKAFFHYVSVVSFVFYVCYLTYIFLPVMGPRIFYGGLTDPLLSAEAWPAEVPPFPESVQAGWFFRLIIFIYEIFEAPGAAFPSSHVAVAAATLWFTWRYLPKVRGIHLVAVALLCVSTVYCRYHYVVDVMAGLAAGTILVWAGNRLYRHFQERPTQASAPGKMAEKT